MQSIISSILEDDYPYEINHVSFMANNDEHNAIINAFPPIYVIHLDNPKYSIRLRYITYVFAKILKIPFKIIKVYPPSTKVLSLCPKHILSVGEIGCYLSHLLCFKIGLENAYNNMIILEDDVFISNKFVTSFIKTINTIKSNNYIGKNPDMWMLGATNYKGNLLKASQIKDNMYQPTVHSQITGTHAIYYSSSALQYYYTVASKNIIFPIDFYLPKMFKKYKGSCFASHPPLCLPEIYTSSINYNIIPFSANESVYYYKTLNGLPNFEKEYIYLMYQLYTTIPLTQSIQNIRISIVCNIKKIIINSHKNINSFKIPPFQEYIAYYQRFPDNWTDFIYYLHDSQTLF